MIAAVQDQNFDPDRSTPAGYWRVAAEYVVAAMSVQAVSDRLLFPTLQLHGQAIELALKAFLLKRGMKLQDVKATRHRLTQALKAARLRRLGTEVKLSRRDIMLIQLLDVNYSRHRFRYIVTGATQVPDIALLSQLCERLVLGLEQYCTGMQWGLARLTRVRR